mmetsp:Transcript_24477/g.37780  ORF Transcript_24477/g.37780 Transcript_24477/m.37780 type:complete len:1463 (-) Transcript_24477:313-4701(-)
MGKGGRSKEKLHYWIKSSILLEHDVSLQVASTRSTMEKIRQSRRLSASALPRRISNGGAALESADWGWARGTVLDENDVDDLELEPLKPLKEDHTLVRIFHDSCVDLKHKIVSLPTHMIGNEEYMVRVNVWAVMEMDPLNVEASSVTSVTPLPLDNLMKLTHLHEPALVNALMKRYEADKIYTDTGPILLALNPLKQCDHLYDAVAMHQYWKLGRKEGTETDGKIAPHVFATADRAFRSMMRSLDGGATNNSSSSDQCILLSGESGTGKTVTAKYLMQYLAFLSQQEASASKKAVVQKYHSKVQNQMLLSTPILESFGNARTARNDNSSRFGKFTEIRFSKTGALAGATIVTHLLEKPRIITQAAGERNYHIFYQLLAGASKEERNEFFLADYQPEHFAITSKSGTYDRRDGVSDGKLFSELKTAMNGLGFSKEDQKNILAVACAILFASNLKILKLSDDHCQVDEKNEFLQPVLSLLGINYDDFDTALCTFSISAGEDSAFSDNYVRSVPQARAVTGLEALMKSTYGALFDLMVYKIQKSSQELDDMADMYSSGAYIGVLDIFGFEKFGVNSFEQLCINYTNEAFQRQFNQFLLEHAQREYEDEGIEWSYINFHDNQDVIDLIDKRGFGILAILDDQCKTVGTTDKTFWSDMHQKVRNHSCYSASYLQVGSRKFEVQHYAGAVEYTTETFVEKNKDELPREATELLKSSKNPFVKSLAGLMRAAKNTSTKSSMIDSSPASRRSSLGGSRKNKGVATVASEFIQQLRTLREKIDLTTPHYIRCLKPNGSLVANQFDPATVVRQLRYAGVLEAVRVSRAGYSHRFPISNFVNRYHSLVANKKYSNDGSSMKHIYHEILKLVTNKIRQDSASNCAPAVSLEDVGMRIGNTKVFVANDVFKILEEFRIAKMEESMASFKSVDPTAMNQYEEGPISYNHVVPDFSPDIDNAGVGDVANSPFVELDQTRRAANTREKSKKKLRFDDTLSDDGGSSVQAKELSESMYELPHEFPDMTAPEVDYNTVSDISHASPKKIEEGKKFDENDLLAIIRERDLLKRELEDMKRHITGDDEKTHYFAFTDQEEHELELLLAKIKEEAGNLQAEKGGARTISSSSDGSLWLTKEIQNISRTVEDMIQEQQAQIQQMMDDQQNAIGGDAMSATTTGGDSEANKSALTNQMIKLSEQVSRLGSKIGRGKSRDDAIFSTASSGDNSTDVLKTSHQSETNSSNGKSAELEYLQLEVEKMKRRAATAELQAQKEHAEAEALREVFAPLLESSSDDNGDAVDLAAAVEAYKKKLALRIAEPLKASSNEGAYDFDTIATDDMAGFIPFDDGNSTVSSVTVVSLIDRLEALINEGGFKSHDRTEEELRNTFRIREVNYEVEEMQREISKAREKLGRSLATIDELERPTTVHSLESAPTATNVFTPEQRTESQSSQGFCSIFNFLRCAAPARAGIDTSGHDTYVS